MGTRKRKIAVIDSETDPFLYGREPKPFIWGFYDGERYEEFYETADLIEFLEAQKLIVYAHNGGKFDYFYFADWLPRYKPLTVINGRLAKFKIGDCEFRDSWNILPVPLAAHDKGEIDYAIFEAGEREKPENAKRISDYLYRDCVSLYEFVSRYIEEFGLNLTLAGGAMKTWSKMTGIEIPQTSRHHYEQFKPYYYGGRVECFEKGIIEGEFSVADINSAYPFAMLHEHAWGTVFNHSEVLPSDSRALALSFIHLIADSKGAFPYRADDGSLYFPDDGEPREFFVTGHEFIAARDTGTLRLHEVINVATPLETISFPEYVNRFYADKARAKELGDKAGYLLAKLMQNSLYGKFGANPAEYQEFIACDPADIEVLNETEGYEPCDFFGPHLIAARPLSESQQHYYNVATAASITGFVRAYLWRSICKCGGVLYCDTDSIAARDVSALEFGKELGQWELEAECDFGAIAGKKLYAFRHAEGWKTASKGVKLSADEIVRVAQGEAVKFENDAPTFSVKRGLRFVDRTVRMT